MPTIGELTPVPKERVYLGERSPNAAKITLMRTREFGASLVNFRISVNGKPAAQMAIGEWTTLSVPPGEVILEARHPADMGGGDSAVIQAVPDGSYYFWVRFSADGAKLVRTTEGSAKGAL